MDIGRQIRTYRTGMGLSQDELAQRVYVTRQTVSNWENGKSCPDLHSLVLLGALFGVSLDTLIQGDLKEMKEKIDPKEIRALERESRVLAVLLVAMVLLPVPLVWFFRWVGLAVYVLLGTAGLYTACRVERRKKARDIQTYKEIVAFTEGRELSEAEKNREAGKRPYQKFLLAVGSGLLTLGVALLMTWLLQKL